MRHLQGLLCRYCPRPVVRYRAYRCAPYRQFTLPQWMICLCGRFRQNVKNTTKLLICCTPVKIYRLQQYVGTTEFFCHQKCQFSFVKKCKFRQKVCHKSQIFASFSPSKKEVLSAVYYVLLLTYSLKSCQNSSRLSALRYWKNTYECPNVLFELVFVCFFFISVSWLWLMNMIISPSVLF